MNDMKINITINDGLLISLLDYLREEGTNKIAQPHLIVGENGSGKTFLLNRLFAEISKAKWFSPPKIFGGSAHLLFKSRLESPLLKKYCHGKKGIRTE